MKTSKKPVKPLENKNTTAPSKPIRGKGIPNKDLINVGLPKLVEEIDPLTILKQCYEALIAADIDVVGEGKLSIEFVDTVKGDEYIEVYKHFIVRPTVNNGLKIIDKLEKRTYLTQTSAAGVVGFCRAIEIFNVWRSTWDKVMANKQAQGAFCVALNHLCELSGIKSIILNR